LATQKLNIKDIFRPQDVAVASGLILIIAMMIIPIPTFLLDLLMVFSVAAGFVMLLISMFLNKPLDFLSFPSVLLVLGSYIRSLKYAGWSALREALPELLEPVLTHLPPEAAIIPLPLHPRRQRERGFNQAQLIAECLAELRQQEILPALRRIRATKQQATLDEVGRQKNMLGAFAIAKKLQSVPRIGILVDDVITTGATLREAAAVLRAAGMQTIVIVTLAKG
jgi:ComF family protein